MVGLFAPQLVLAYICVGRARFARSWRCYSWLDLICFIGPQTIAKGAGKLDSLNVCLRQETRTPQIRAASEVLTQRFRSPAAADADAGTQTLLIANMNTQQRSMR